jgi:peroxiredoxin family protein
MNMLGAGAAMLRKMMEEKRVLSMEAFLELAKESGVKLYVCSMSMDVMGIGRQELTDGIEVAGVATYLQEARYSGITLFI